MPNGCNHGAGGVECPFLGPDLSIIGVARDHSKGLLEDLLSEGNCCLLGEFSSSQFEEGPEASTLRFVLVKSRVSHDRKGWRLSAKGGTFLKLGDFNLPAILRKHVLTITAFNWSLHYQVFVERLREVILANTEGLLGSNQSAKGLQAVSWDSPMSKTVVFHDDSNWK